MIEKCFGEKKFSSSGMYIRSTSDILPKWEGIRSSYILPNWGDMRSIADISTLYAILSKGNIKNNEYMYVKKKSQLKMRFERVNIW